MTKIVSVQSMRKIEAAADAAGETYAMMMEQAGQAAADCAKVLLEGLTEPRVTVLVGPGNNGGDGLVAGRLLAQDGTVEVRFYLLTRREDTDPNFKAVQDAGLFIAYAEDDRDQRVLRNMVGSADLVVDALFGIGVKLPLRSDAAKVLRSVNQVLHELRTASAETTFTTPAMTDAFPRTVSPVVLAIDCPSGLDCDSGELDKNTIYADATITFIAAKPGLLTFPGAEAVGDLHTAPLKIPELKELNGEPWTLADSAAVRALLPTRPVNSHKGTYGKALIVAGSVNYMGAAGLAAQSAYRVGAGLVTVGAPQPVIQVLAARLAEPTWLLLPHDMGVVAEAAAKIILEEANDYTALLLGPGFGRENTTRDMLRKLFEDATESIHRAQREIGFQTTETVREKQKNSEQQTQLPPLVIDADALNLLSELEQWWTRLPKNTILTPHPGEMARLAGVETSDIQANRTALALEKAAAWGVVVVLKGAHTLIASPEGRLAVLPFKNPALAKAGTGDVLAGVIVGLLAQGLTPYDAALAGGYLHGLAGQIATEWINARSVVASDVVETLSDALDLVEGA